MVAMNALSAALGAALLASLAAAPARAALSCGSLVTHAQALASAQGQQPAQAIDTEAHPLPWTNDLTEQAGSSSAHKLVEASCQNTGGSVSIDLASTEWGTVAPSQNGDQVRASWAPVWTAQLSLPPHKQLSISVTSNVNYLTCQFIAPGVAMNWSGSYGNSMMTADGIGPFTARLSCTSNGLHDVSRQAFSGWVNGKSILIDLTVLDVPRPAF